MGFLVRTFPDPFNFYVSIFTATEIMLGGIHKLRTVKPLLEDALLFNSQILERASIQGFQNFM